MKKFMPSIFILVFGLCVMSFQVADTTNDTDIVQWGTKLKLDDFKGTVDTKKDQNSFSYIIYTYNEKITGDSVKVVLKNTFYRKYSWIKNEVKTKEQLNHEQGFFDISAINAARMRKTLLTNPIYKNTANKQIGALYSQTIKDRAKEQGQYQAETEYGKNKVKQSEWDKKLKDLLKTLEKYNGQAITIKMK